MSHQSQDSSSYQGGQNAINGDEIAEASRFFEQEIIQKAEGITSSMNQSNENTKEEIIRQLRELIRQSELQRLEKDKKNSKLDSQNNRLSMQTFTLNQKVAQLTDQLRLKSQMVELQDSLKQGYGSVENILKDMIEKQKENSERKLQLEKIKQITDRESIILAKQQKIKDLQTKLKLSASTIDIRDGRIKTLTDQAESLKEEVRSQRQRYINKQAEFYKRKKELEAQFSQMKRFFQQQRSNYQRNVQAQRTNLNQANSQIQSLTRQKLAITKEKERCLSEIRELQKQKQAAQDQLKQLRAKSQKQSTSFDQKIKAERTKFENLIQSMKNENKKSIEKEKNDYDQSVVKIRASMQKNMEQIKKEYMKSEQHYKQTAKNAKEDLIKKERQLKQKIDTLTKQKDQLQKLSSSLSTKIDQDKISSKVQRQKAKEQLNQAYSLLKNVIKALNLPNSTKYEDISKQIASILQNMDSLYQQQSNSLIEMTGKQQKIDLQKKIIINWLEDIRKQYQIGKQFKKMKILNNSRAQELEMGKKVKTLLDTVANIEKEKQETIQSEKQRNQTLSAQLKTTQYNLQLLQNTKERNSKEINKLNEQLDLQKQSMLEVQLLKEIFESKYKKQSQELLAKDKANFELSNRLKEAEKTKEALQVLQRQYQNSQDSLERANQDLTKLQADLARQKDNLNGRITDIRSSMQKKQTELASRQTKIRRLQEEVSKARQKQELNIKEITGLKAKITQNNKDMQDLHEEIKQFNEMHERQYLQIVNAFEETLQKKPNSSNYMDIVSFIRTLSSGSNDTTLTVSLILEKQPEIRKFILGQVTKFLNKPKITTTLLFKYDDFSRSIGSYIPTLRNSFPFLLIMRSQKGEIFGMIASAVGNGSQALAFNASKRTIFRKTERSELVKGVEYTAGYLSFGNSEIRLKSNGNCEVFVVNGMIGQRYFDFDREQLAGLNEEKEAVLLSAIELHKIQF